MDKTGVRRISLIAGSTSSCSFPAPDEAGQKPDGNRTETGYKPDASRTESDLSGTSVPHSANCVRQISEGDNLSAKGVTLC
jgi:hypothetical protein